MNGFGEVLICNDATKFVEMTIGIYEEKIYFDVIGEQINNLFYPSIESLRQLQKFLNDNLK